MRTHKFVIFKDVLFDKISLYYGLNGATLEQGRTNTLELEITIPRDFSLNLHQESKEKGGAQVLTKVIDSKEEANY